MGDRMGAVTLVVLLAALFAAGRAGVPELETLMGQLEDKVSELATSVEDAQFRRCDPAAMEACAEQNYHDCGTKLPNPQCDDGSQAP